MQISKILLSVFLLAVSLGQCPAIAAEDSCNNSPSYSPYMGGPLQIGVSDSSEFGINVNTKWINYLIYPHTGFGFELDFGGGEFRLAGTLAHSFSPENRAKITAEHFAQSFNFTFVVGKPMQWIGQNDFGATYQYIVLDNAWLKNFQANAYYANAETESMGDKIFSNNQGTFTDIRDFNGGTLFGTYVGMTVAPWRYCRVGLGLNYDNLQYSPQYVASPSTSGVGATASLEQILTDRFKINLLATARAPYDQYQASAAYLIPTRPGTRLELAVLGSHLSVQNYVSTDNRVVVTLGYSWGGDPNSPKITYTNQDPDDMLKWTNEPAVYMPAVFMIKDETVV